MHVCMDGIGQLDKAATERHTGQQSRQTRMSRMLTHAIPGNCHVGLIHYGEPTHRPSISITRACGDHYITRYETNFQSCSARFSGLKQYCFHHTNNFLFFNLYTWLVNWFQHMQLFFFNLKVTSPWPLFLPDSKQLPFYEAIS